jgi:hypothetical protein
VYRVYVTPFEPGTQGTYTVTASATTVPVPALGQPVSEEVPPLRAVTFTLPDDAAQVAVVTAEGAVELTLDAAAGDAECVSPRDLAGTRLALLPGRGRVAVVRDLASTPATVVVTAT